MAPWRPSRPQPVFATCATAAAGSRRDHETALSQRQPLRIAVAGGFGRYQRHAVPFGKGRSDFRHRLVARAPVPARSAVVVLLGMRPCRRGCRRERRFAEIILQHADQRLPLL